MKKIFLSMLSIGLLFFITGCGENKTNESNNKTDKELLLESMKPIMENYDSITILVKSEINTIINEEPSLQSTEMTIMDDYKNKKSYVKTIMKIGTYENQMEVYSIENEENITQYSKGKIFGMGSDDWIKTTEDLKVKEEYDVSSFNDAINNYEVKKVNSDISGMDKYLITVPKDKINTLLNDSDSETSNYTYENAVEATYYIKDKMITKIIIDLTNSAKSGETVFTKFMTTVEFSNLNNTIVNIPDEVLNTN